MSEIKKTVITCPELLDISILAEFRDKLQTALETKQDVQFQAATVERADTAALQLLCAFFLDAQAQGLDAEWLDPSETLRGAAKQIGLAEHLGLTDKTLH